VNRFLLGASGAGRLCALGANGWGFCAAPQLHREADLEMPQSRTVSLIIAGFALATLTSCGLNESRRHAEALADSYFVAAAAENYDAVLALYSQEFFLVSPRETFRTVLTQVHERCGRPKSHTLTGWNARSNFMDGSARVNLAYDVNYARCRVAETIGVDISDGGKAKISGHHLQIIEARPPGQSSPETV